jgi:hypothetical protein
MVVDLVAICDLGSHVEFSTIVEVYLPINPRILLTMLRGGAEQEHFLEDDLTWRPDVTVLMAHGWRGDMCHSKIG